MIDATRPRKAPRSLAAKKGYRGKDVRLELHATFLRKCYLCETPVELGTFTIDHRKPKKDPRFVKLMHAWSNLFPACNRFSCNGRRKKDYPRGGLLSPGQGVQKRVLQKVECTVSTCLRQIGMNAFVFSAKDPGEVAARNTAKELDRIHNGTDSTAGDVADGLQRAILDHLVTVAAVVMDYLSSVAGPADPVALDSSREKVRKFVSRGAPYCMLVRNYFGHYRVVNVLFD